MAKPTEDYSWASDATAEEIQTPTVAQRTKGVERGSTWTRKRTNWMFHQWGKMLNWVRDFGMDTSKNLSDLEDKSTSRTNLGVLKSGTGNEETRTNLQNDSRFVVGQKGTLAANFRNNGENDTRFGIKGTAASEVRVNSQNDVRFVQGQKGTAPTNFSNNSENDSRFVQHTEVINNLSSTQTSLPLSANMGKILNDKVDYKLDKGAGGTQARNNSENDLRFLNASSNLSDLPSRGTARTNLGIKTGTVTLASNSNTSINLGMIVVGATVSVYSTDESANQVGCTWSGTYLNIRNSLGGTNTISYIAIGG